MDFGANQTRTSRPSVRIDMFFFCRLFSLCEMSTKYLDPRSPRNFSVVATSSSSLRLTWSAPVDSIFTNYVIRYAYHPDSINWHCFDFVFLFAPSYRTADNVSWSELSSVVNTETELKQLTAGERYVLLINSASHRVESAAPIELQHTLCELSSDMQADRNCV